MAKSFQHQALEITDVDKPLVYTAMSKHLFYLREHISKFVLEQGAVPLNPFMTFNYFLLDSVKRDLVRQGNNVLVARADELWQFGPVSNGALAEIVQAHAQGKPVRYFSFESTLESTTLFECKIEDVELESDVADQRDKL